jgi:hypothetical protein
VVVVSTATASETVQPLVVSPVTSASWRAPASSPKTLSVPRLVSATVATEAS